MRIRTLVPVLAAAAIAVAGLAAPPAAQAAPAGQPGIDDFAGIVKISGCSAALVKFRQAPLTSKALMLTNGHCLESGMPGAGEVIVDKSSSISLTLLKPDGSSAATLRAERILYATMTDTDAALYRLTTTYQDIKTKYATDAHIIAEQGPKVGDKITVTSGYWKSHHRCAMEKQVYQLREHPWTWKDSIRYTRECLTKHGSSGSPLFGDASGEVVGVNNTGNDGTDKACAQDNPCEVDEQGNVHEVPKDTNYAQQTWWFTTCLNDKVELDISVTGCRLPKPKRR